MFVNYRTNLAEASVGDKRDCEQGRSWEERQSKEPYRSLRARLENRFDCRSRRKEAQIPRPFRRDQSLLTSPPTISKHVLRQIATLWSPPRGPSPAKVCC